MRNVRSRITRDTLLFCHNKCIIESYLPRLHITSLKDDSLEKVLKKTLLFIYFLSVIFYHKFYIELNLTRF